MNGLILAVLMSATPADGDEWADARTIKLDPAVVVTLKADKTAAQPEGPVEVVEIPDGPPLVAEKTEDGRVVLQHREVEAADDPQEEQR